MQRNHIHITLQFEFDSAASYVLLDSPHTPLCFQLAGDSVGLRKVSESRFFLANLKVCVAFDVRKDELKVQRFGGQLRFEYELQMLCYVGTLQQ